MIKFIMLLFLYSARVHADAQTRICFPKNFTFGVATSAYQIEGAWNELDEHNFKDDLEILENLGAQFYSFSISWSRVLPSGFSNEVSSAGLAYYRGFMEDLLRRGVQPVVTIGHPDLPRSLQDLGGWTNPEIADYFVDYARVLFEAFGDKVLTWMTFNGPQSICLSRHAGAEAPEPYSSGWESYLCGHNVLRAHAMVYRTYRREYYPTQRGRVGFGTEAPWVEPGSAWREDQAAAARARHFYIGWFLHPIFSEEGDYPPVMRQQIDDISKYQKFPRSRLPTISRHDLEIIRGSADFLGLSHFSTNFANALYLKSYSKYPSFEEDMGVIFTQNAKTADSKKQLQLLSSGFRRVLNWIKENYNNPAAIVVANGVSTGPGLRDLKRVQYLEGHLRSLHAAVTLDGCNVRAYAYCGLTDRYQWTNYSGSSGLYEVNVASAARMSAAYFRRVSATRCLPDSKTLIKT